MILKDVKGPWFSKRKEGDSDYYIYMKGASVPTALARARVQPLYGVTNRSFAGEAALLGFAMVGPFPCNKGGESRL